MWDKILIPSALLQGRTGTAAPAKFCWEASKLLCHASKIFVLFFFVLVPFATSALVLFEMSSVC